MLKLLLSFLSIAGLYLYLEQPSPEAPVSSVFFVLISPLFYALWRRVEERGLHRRQVVFSAVFAVLFSMFTVAGKLLDHGVDDRELLAALTILLLCFTVFPVIGFLTDVIRKKEFDPTKTPVTPKMISLCFCVIVPVWFLVWLAAFPGIFAVDAMTWYLSFSDPTVPVTAQWSPLYAGLFYAFVHTGYSVTASYIPGMALFSFLQMVFILCVVHRILVFCAERGGKRMLLASTLFFSLLPTHAVMAVQTVQGAPAMACSAMICLHLVRMTEDPASYWSGRRNAIHLIVWGILTCILRNNLYVVFVLLIPFTLFFYRSHRKQLLLSFLAIVALVSVYKGPLLRFAGVRPGPTLQESLSLPLQQLACVYALFPDRMTEDDRALMRSYVPEEYLLNYERESGISDAVKGHLNTELLSEDPAAFLKLYLRVGLRAPKAYIRAALLQNLGLWYIDKQYPDARIYHPYLNYASYELDNPVFIHITRRSLLPPLDRLLLLLFGNADHSYGGDVSSYFNAIPVIGPLCRASLYFWVLVFMTLYRIFFRGGPSSLLLLFAWLITCSLFFGPVIVYRYYAPVIFSMPVMLSVFLYQSSLSQSIVLKKERAQDE